MGTGPISSGGMVEFAASLYGTDDDPMDTVIMRDGIHQGLHHAADSMAQVRVNYMCIASGVTQDQDVYETTETISSVDDWYNVGGSPFGPWPLTLRADGSGYRLRIRLAAAISADTAVATFRVVITPPRRLVTADITAGVDSTMQGTTSSATPAWLTLQSQGSAGSLLVAIVSADQARGWITDVPAYDAVSSPAAGHTVQQCLVSAYVFAKISNTARLPRLYALHVQEYVGRDYSEGFGA